ncbi:MAG: hypothetical protein ACYDBQ_00790 [Thermoplasmatota archaeon]
MPITPGNTTSTGSYARDLLHPLDAGTYWYAAVATDVAGNGYASPETRTPKP